ncbi:hypothetical protein DMC64_07125 [Amycolatopsis sp. WAC 04197]|uniref:hypothetical protein n=1 Tax=Amycolatopsis sp. WAC 04197 TaxID=2203199 RepID=UPI000F786A0D|nr:hypothetical protein [Amycolatopsis sp. WAC 04197]RSN47076.1 hypothetical protein DMC64_07125 [Amycolatopsis sp. WAC 04197]
MRVFHHDPPPGAPFIEPIVPPSRPEPPHGPPKVKESIRIYRPGDPAEIGGKAELIQRALFPDVRERRLQVHPASGALWFGGARRTGGPRPPSPIQAREAAAAFLADARRRLTAEDGRLAGIVPGDLRLLDTWAGSEGGGDRGGTTVCRFARTLRPSPAEPPVPVFGEMVEIWVDAAGVVRSFGSTCRLLVADTTVARLPSPDPETYHDHGKEAGLIYLSGDEDEERDAICPFWIRWGEELAVISPASGHSMAVRLVPTRFPGGVALEALTVGGSGRFEYSWQAWSPLAPAEFVSLSRGASARVGVGVWDVVARVRDVVNDVTEKAMLRVVGSNG